MTPEQVAATEAQNAKLLAESKRIETTESLLQPRSQGWSALEPMLQLFPEGDDARLESFDYKITPEGSLTGGQATNTNAKVGMVRQWQFKGLGKPQTMQLLTALNSQLGLTTFFEKLASTTGDTSFQPGPTRQMDLTVTESRNPKFNADSSPGDLARDPASAYPYVFEATLSQTLTEKDPLALPVAKPL